VTERRTEPLPGADAPSAEVLDELLRAFSADVTDRAKLEQIDLGSPEVDELISGSPSQVESQPEVESETSTVQLSPEAEVPVETEVLPEDTEPRDASSDAEEGPPAPDDRQASTTIVISAEDELPDAVYLAAGDPLLQATTVAPPTVTGGGQRVFIDDTSGTEGDVLPMEAAATATRIEPRLRERRIAVKRATTRKRLKWALIVVGLIAIVVATLAVLGSGLFAIDDVEVEGAVYTDPAALEAVVEDLRGTPVLRADTGEAERTLERIPWVENARVTTYFPDRARIELRERRPVASYQAEDGSFRVIDPDGRVLDMLPAQPVDYLPVTSAEVPALNPGEFAPAGFRSAASLVDALTPGMRAIAASVVVAPDASDLRLLLTDGVEVHFGAGTDLVAKLVRLQTWLDIGRDGAVTSVDVSTDEVTTTP